MPVRDKQGSTVRPGMWLLLGPHEPGVEYSDENMAAFRAAFGPECVMYSSELVMALEDGRLTLRDRSGRAVQAPRVAYPRLYTSVLDVNREISLLSHLQAMGTVLFNGVDAYLNCANKFRQLQLLSLAGLPVPDTYAHADGTLAGAVDAGVPEPFVVKAVQGMRGNRVFLATHGLVRDLQGSLREDSPYMCQRFHDSSHGRDLRVVVVDGQAIGAMVRSNTQGGFKSNIALGGTAEPCLGRYPEGERLACLAAQAVGADLAGVDLLFEPDGRFTICEVNASPGNKILPQVTSTIVAACAARVDEATHEPGPPKRSQPMPQPHTLSRMAAR